jgi:GTPase SAR1 family protein
MFEASTNGNAQGVQMLGLYGMGGVGKTTMCKALCNRFQHRFQGRVCHVELGPREKYLDLQKKVLKKLTNLGDQALQNITDSDEVR